MGRGVADQRARPQVSVLERFFKERFPALRRALQKTLPPGEDAEDIAQEALLRAHATGRMETLDHPVAYIATTARHLALDHMRKRTTKEAYAEDMRQGDIAYFWGKSPEDHVHYRRSLEHLSQAILALPPRTRKAFVLRKFYNLPYKAIAAEMEISEKTVQKHIAKGLIACRKHLAAEGYFNADGKTLT
ncbi:MAG: RNA polymerase sigma factor [Pseudomonadota bacterium]